MQGSKGRGKHKGHGRIVVTRLNEDPGAYGGSCVWETEKVIKIPKTAKFEDYSDLAIRKSADSSIARVLITSQEEAAVWAGLLDLDTFEFQGDGVVLHFPRSGADCKQVYCNIEGVQFIDECVPDGMLELLLSCTYSRWPKHVKTRHRRCSLCGMDDIMNMWLRSRHSRLCVV